MFLQIFLFELYYRLRRPTTWIYFALLMIVIFLTVAIDGVTFGANNIYKNAPCPIALALVVGSALGMLISSAMFSPTVQRDYETGIYPLYFTTPISKFAYLGGRFAGTFVVTALIFTALPLGIYIGSIICPPLGWTDAARIGPNHFINFSRM
jgi:ABC-type transport system involved in multi-copper enzyme maturation permease subunit